MKRLAVSLALFLLNCAPAHAEADSWQEHYKGGNYHRAADLLKPIVEKKEDIALHYYLADCYYRTKKTSEALHHYERAYRLDPQGKFARYSLQVLKAHNRATALIAEKPATVDNTAQASRDDAAVDADIIKKLPLIVKQKPETPTLEQLTTWSIADQVKYYPEAQARLERAQHGLTTARAMSGSAYSLLHSMVESARVHGETEAALKARVAMGQAKVARIQQPYKENIKLHEGYVSYAQSILNICENAVQNSGLPYR